MSVNRGTIGELPSDIEVAMRVGHRTDDVVPELTWSFIPRVGLHPLEVLGMKGIKN